MAVGVLISVLRNRRDQALAAAAAKQPLA
jgi:hypothetical protein